MKRDVGRGRGLLMNIAGLPGPGGRLIQIFRGFRRFIYENRWVGGGVLFIREVPR